MITTDATNPNRKSCRRCKRWLGADTRERFCKDCKRVITQAAINAFAGIGPEHVNRDDIQNRPPS